MKLLRQEEKLLEGNAPDVPERPCSGSGKRICDEMRYDRIDHLIDRHPTATRKRSRKCGGQTVFLC